MSPKTILNRYLKKLTEVVSTADAREESFYSALKDLLQEFSQATERSDIHVTILPRPTEAGNPDFRIWDGIGHIVGYMEAKSPSTDLNKVAFSEQLQRYLATFPNLILTNFLEFWLFRDGLRIATARLARPVILTELQTRPPIENADEV
ncbi:MAG: DNA methyltransferase, partial [Deltaproteobacteria bacterium]|nr:DNA methyltransferase [Deltaproteobacteria bacterium]MBW2127243.1 DNA methyltransferase [Deltaproteobacteria bacterium]